MKQSAILQAEGEKQSAILRAEGQAQSTILRAQGESKAILQLFDAIHKGDADPKLLAYEYIRTLPQIANSSSSKVWVIPSELTAAMNSISSGFSGPSRDASESTGLEAETALTDTLAATSLPDLESALAAAKDEAGRAASETTGSGTQGQPFDPDAEAGQRPNNPLG